MAEFETPRGTRDFFPEDMVKRRFVIETARTVYERFGYREMETPAFESWGVLAAKSGGGDDVTKQVFKFKDYGGRVMGLRFDLTVPMTRFVANNPQLPKPFKRSQIGRVWRYERPQPGRFREFWQADVDIIGSKEPESDVDPVAAMVAALQELGFKELVVKVNNRRLLEGIAENFGMPAERAVELFRSIDKLEKIGVDEVEKELLDKGFENVRELLIALQTEGTPEEVLSAAEKLVKDKALVEPLRKFIEFAEYYGIYDFIQIDLTLSRGLEYYTDTVYEVKIKGGEKYGSVAGGGRFDNLIGLYADETLPAVGISMGVERVIEIMEQEKMFDSLPTINTRAFVVPISESVLSYAFKTAAELRSAGIATDIDFLRRGLSKQLAYASTLGVPYTIIIGEKEAKDNKVTLRDMTTGDQKLLTIPEAIKHLQ